MDRSSSAFRNALVAALGGFLFGFDTAVISGVEKSIQTLWSLDDFSHGFTVASALIGTVIGSMIAGQPAERYGRKKVLQIIGVLYLVTSLVTALTPSWLPFVISPPPVLEKSSMILFPSIFIVLKRGPE